MLEIKGNVIYLRKFLVKKEFPFLLPVTKKYLTIPHVCAAFF